MPLRIEHVRMLLVGVLLLVYLGAPMPSFATDPVEFRALTWNIWHGGKEDGEEIGPKKVVDLLRKSEADVIAIQETYGSGEKLAAGLKFHFQPRGTNVSILSRFPILEDISVFEEFKCAGALVELPGGQRVAFYSLWLPYDAEIWEVGSRKTTEASELEKACRSSQRDLLAIREAIFKRLSGEKYASVPIVLAGDFNSMSHLDYSEAARDQYRAVVDWPTSRVMSEAGFRDAYRELHPQIDRARDRTWSPRFPKQEQDRIDFLYYRGEGLEAIESSVLDAHPEGFPSDHGAVVARFRLDANPRPAADFALRAVSYNIKHGQGNDDVVNLDRTAETLKTLRADIIGLQEVDFVAKRSGSQNQPAELGKRLGMHAAFGSFMDFDGGQYGLAILSRYPLRGVKSLRLPDGNEPRVALVAEVRLPSGESVNVVCVHFDWVRDDKFRFAQASEVAKYLRELKTPYILLGDFNDQPKSRTLELFQSLANEVKKVETNRFTFSSTSPRSEIDFLFVSPKSRWGEAKTEVIDEKMTSDHRPIVAELVLKAGK